MYMKRRWTLIVFHQIWRCVFVKTRVGIGNPFHDYNMPFILQDLYIHRAEHLYYTTFGVESFLGRRFTQFRTLIFSIVRNQHFFLLIGYVDRGRFEYYNSIMGHDGDQQFAEEFVSLFYLFQLIQCHVTHYKFGWIFYSKLNWNY